ncbi:MAG: chromosome segregation protein, partial [Gammaproteobacteria bacterium]
RSVEKTRECDKAFTEAQQAYAAIDTSGRAMIAETKRQQSMADIASAAASYIRVQTAYRLLSSGLEQFRAQHQGPLLRSASTFFHDITGGRYNELSVDYETSELRAKDQSGYKKPQALSEGTRNQLYLALRLAALTQQLAAGTQLPFIADDLLITFDEERAGNALKGLHRLSEQTQVIYFTHQAEIERIAQSVLGSSVNIIRL